MSPFPPWVAMVRQRCVWASIRPGSTVRSERSTHLRPRGRGDARAHRPDDAALDQDLLPGRDSSGGGIDQPPGADEHRLGAGEERDQEEQEGGAETNRRFTGREPRRGEGSPSYASGPHGRGAFSTLRTPATRADMPLRCTHSRAAPYAPWRSWGRDSTAPSSSSPCWPSCHWPAAPRHPDSRRAPSPAPRTSTTRCTSPWTPRATVVTFPQEDLEQHQRRGFRPASQEQAKALVRRECPAGFR